MAKTIIHVILSIALAIMYTGFQADCFDDTEIHGYHFHTYFYQKNAESTDEALRFRYVMNLHH